MRARPLAGPEADLPLAFFEAVLESLRFHKAPYAIITGGVVAFTGSTVINTSMATVVAKVASQVSDPSVTNGQYVTVEDGDTAGWIRVKSWKPTAANNVEPAEGSASVTASWFALGSD